MVTQDDGVFDRSRRRRGRPQLQLEVLERQLQMLLHESIHQPLRVHEVCQRLGISATSLQKLVHALYGMSFHQYVISRRLHAVRSAIVSPTTGTVSSICGQYGVWDFGRFAQRYRQQFGVAPSREHRRARSH